MKTTLLAMLALLCFTFAASAADVTGHWSAEITTGRGPQAITFNFSQSGSTLTGTVVAGGRGGEIMIVDGKVDGDNISFSTSEPGRGDGAPPNVQKYIGKINGASIDFTRDNGRGPVMFTAKKQ
jgi:hypothetical protein